MLGSLFNRLFPKADRSLWLGLYRERDDLIMGLAALVLIGFGTAVLIYSVRAGEDAGAYVFGGFALLLGLIFAVVLLVDIILTPLRVDFLPDEIEWVHWLGRKRMPIRRITEVRMEKRTIKLRGGRSAVHHHLVWELDDSKKYSFKLGPFGERLDALFDQLETHDWIIFFRNKTETPIRFDLFGTGSDKPMETYLADATAVPIHTLDDIKKFLQSCKYERDIHQFDKSDHWLLPSEMEQTKRGDCEDHALWTWQKLHQLGIPAEFVTGTYKMQNGEWGGHAWIQFRQDGKLFVFETVDKSGSMVHAWEKAKERYRPGLSIDHAMRTFHYREEA